MSIRVVLATVGFGVLLTTSLVAQVNLRDTTSGIAFQLPTNWIGISRPGFLSMRLEDPSGWPTFLITSMVEALVGQRVKIDQYKRITYETHYEHYGAPERWHERDTVFRGLPSYVVDFSYPHGGDGEEVLVRRIVVFKNRTAYVLSAESREEHWEALLEHFSVALQRAEIPTK